MAFSISTRSALDGSGATIPGGVVFIDESGVGTGPWIITKCTIDPAGANVQFVLSNNAAKCDVSSINGTTVVTGTGASGAGIPRVTVSNDSNILATQSGAWTVTANQGGAPWTVNPGTAANWGVGATGAAVPANSPYVAGNAITALPTAATAGNLTGLSVDKFGRAVVLPGTTRDNVGTQTTTISNSTTETTIVTAGGAGVFNDITKLIVSSTAASGTDTRIDFRDTTAGTIIFSLEVRGGSNPTGFADGARPLPQTTSNTNWTAQCATAVTDIRIFVQFDKNK